MIIDSPNQLREWLTGYLPPLCDADPEVLAKYCLALVKKDRPDDELKTSLIAQLDVFLKTNTASFVEKLLEVAKSKSYMKEGTVASPAKSLTKGEEPQTEGTSPMSADNSPSKDDTIVPEKTVLPSKESSPQPPLPPLPPPVHSIPYPPPETTPPYPAPKKEDTTLPSKVRKSEPKEKEREEGRRGRRSSRPRENKTRSRSRDRERSRRSRSPRGVRSSRSKYEDRRRRSPHSRGPLKRYSRRTRSRTRSPRWSRSPVRRSRSRDRRSRSRNNRSRSLSPKRHHSRHKSRSRTPKVTSMNDSSPRKSPAKEEKESSASPEASSGDTTSAPPPIVHSVVSIPNQDRYTISKSQRCRDYDEQGFCMRGDQCPYDHGTDPVVLEGGALDFPPPLTGVPPVTGVAYPPLSAPSIPRDIPPGRGFLRHPPPPRPAQFGEYTPNNPGLWGSDGIVSSAPYYGSRGRGIGGPPPRFPGPPPPIAPQEMGRELISVPVNGANQGKTGIRSSLAQRLGPASSNAFPSNGTFSGTQASHAGTKYSNSSENCTLELRKIPAGLNTISHLNQHFAKFGTIINIQVHHDGDPEAALVTFSSHSEANAAYRSTEAVLNNRFIKLFWHNSSKGEVPSSTTNLQRSVHDRLGLRNPNKSLNNKVQSMEAVSSENEKVIISRGSLVKTVFNPSAIKVTPVSTVVEEEPAPQIEETVEQTDDKNLVEMRTVPPKVAAPDSTQQQMTIVDIKKKEIEKIRKQQELLKAELLAKQKVEQQKADALKLKNEVENRTKQLLKEQMQHVKLLINKLEKNKSTMKPEEIKVLLNTIKSLQNAVETTKAQLASSVPPTPKAPPKPKTKAQLEKEILDTELELYTLQSEGGDVTRIRTRLQQLKTQMVQMKAPKHPKTFPHPSPRPTLIPKVMRGRGMARGRGRGRGRPYGGNFSAVDRRSTCINASGFEREDKSEVLTHFGGLGNVSTYSWDKLTPSVTVQYSTRRDAERAMSEGRNLGDRLLTLTWVSEASAGFSPPQPVTVASTTPSAEEDPVLQKTSVSSSSASSHTATSAGHDEEEEITEEIVEEEVEETEEIGSYIYEDEVEEEEEEREEEEEGGRSWRR